MEPAENGLMASDVSGDGLREAPFALRTVLGVSGGMFLVGLDLAIMAAALPDAVDDLRAGLATGVWFQTIFLLASAVCLLPVARLADRHGLRRLHVIGLVAYVGGSALGAVAWTAATLLVARAVQGAAAAAIMSTSPALAAAQSTAGTRGRAMGINVAGVYLGYSLGPVIGGALVDLLGWRGFFYINGLVGIAVLSFARRHAGANRPSRAASDGAGAVVLSAGLVALIVPLAVAPRVGWSALALASVGVAVVLLMFVFPRVERRVSDPLLDTGLFASNRDFAAGNISTLLVYGGYAAVALLTSTLLQLNGSTATMAGVAVLPQAVIMLLLAPQAGRLSDRFGRRPVATVGALFVTAGLLSLATVADDPSLWDLGLRIILIGAGIGLFSSPAIAAVVGAVAPTRLGQASATVALMRGIGQTVSVALLGSIAASGVTDTSRAAGAAFAAGYRRAMLLAAVATAVAGAASWFIKDRPEIRSKA